jgi:hypothetical protein
MSIKQRDYILRMIEQLAETLASIAGLKAKGKVDEAEQLVRATVDGLVGPLRGALEGVDAASAAALLGSREKLGAYAALIAEEGSILELKGDARGARRARRRALDLYRELARAGGAGGADEKASEAIRSLEAALSGAGPGGSAP